MATNDIVNKFIEIFPGDGSYQWYEAVPEADRDAFARELCSNVYSYHGQAVVVCSYPRRDGDVYVYDMDSGSMFLVNVQECAVGKAFNAVLRPSERQDFERSSIMMSRVCDEATDIAAGLFG